MRYLSIPKVQLALLLFVLLFANLINNFSPYLLIYYSLTVGLTVFVDYLFVWVRKIKPFFLSAAIVTGEIICLVNSPRNKLFETFIIIVLAIASKHFLKLRGRHIFNPAAFGLFFGSLIFNKSVSWLGVSSLLPLILLTGYVSVFRSRKLYLISIFYFLFNIGIYLISKQINFFDPITAFFILVMLPEPMTSPNRPIRQIFYGILTAVLALIFSIPNILLGSLLVSNLLFANKK